MKTQLKPFILASLGLIFLAGCLGIEGPTSEENDNENNNNNNSSSSRQLTGSVPALTQGSNLSSLHDGEEPGECAADTIIATDSSAETVSVAIDEDCDFAVTLEIGKSYVLSLSHENSFVATLIFDTGASFSSDNVTVGAGSGPIQLGEITITGNVAIPEFEPCDQMDTDDDGVVDFDDEDDDGDGIEDEFEDDCDLDGFLNDHDFDMEDCDEGEEDEEDEEDDEAYVLEVKPRNDSHPELGEDRVDLDRDIKARINCSVDSDTVNEDTFIIYHDDEELDCNYRGNSHGKGKLGTQTTIECEPNEDMHSDALYTALIDGVMCRDGREVETVAWSWLTEPYDDDEGHYEDYLDELFEELFGGEDDDDWDDDDWEDEDEDDDWDEDDDEEDDWEDEE